MAQPQICFAEFAQEEKDLFQIRESLREFAANGEISPPAGGDKGYSPLTSQTFEKV